MPATTRTVISLLFFCVGILGSAPLLAGNDSTSKASARHYKDPARNNGQLTIERFQLQFEDNSIIRVFTRSQKVRAIARINFRGTGTLKAEWEAAEPTTILGSPTFRTLQKVQTLLGGTRQVELLSPELPVALLGQYIVRLRLIEPTLKNGSPLVRYFVIESWPQQEGANDPNIE
jgi:hypothetical protein